MLKPFALLLLLAACAHTSLPAPQPDDRIILSDRGSIHGGHSLIVTPDDRVVYDAYGTDIAPQTPGWTWQDPSHQTGQASLTAPGAYERAFAVMNRKPLLAETDPHTPCPEAGQSAIVLANTSGILREYVLFGCRANASDSAYATAFLNLQSTLRAAILPSGWLTR